MLFDPPAATAHDGEEAELSPAPVDYDDTVTYYSYYIPPALFGMLEDLNLPLAILAVSDMVAKERPSMSIKRALREYNRIGRVTGRFFGIKHPAFFTNFGIPELVTCSIPMISSYMLSGLICGAVLGIPSAEDENWPYLSYPMEPLDPEPCEWWTEDWTCSACNTINVHNSSRCRVCLGSKERLARPRKRWGWLQPFITQVTSHVVWTVCALPSSIALHRLLVQPCAQGVEYSLPSYTSAIGRFVKSGGVVAAIKHMWMCAPAAIAACLCLEMARSVAHSISPGGLFYRAIPQATPPSYHPSMGFTKERALDSLAHATGVAINGLCLPAIMYAVSLPFLVVQARLMVQGSPYSDTEYSGFCDCAWQLWTEEGLVGFYRGFTATYLRSILVSLPMIVAADLISSRFISAFNGPVLRHDDRKRGDEEHDD